MPTFRYIAINAKGEKIKGEVEAKDRGNVTSFLKKEPVTIISVAEIKAQKISFLEREKIKLNDQVVFFRQLATLVKTGVPLVKGLGIISSQVKNQALRNVVSSLQVNIESGRSLSEALAGHPRVFSSISINMVRAGEMGGALDTVLDKIATYLEEVSKLTRKIKGALVYPAVVITMAVLITSFIFIRVIPSFNQMFLTLNIRLPLPTRIIIKISDIIKISFPWVLVSGIVMFILLKRYIRTENGRLRFDKMRLRLPVLGDILLKVVIARFSRTLATLVKSGISIIDALETVARTTGNLVVERTLTAVRARVARGEKIGESLQASGAEIFTPMVIDMISVGEETGNISPMLDKISDFYEAEVDSAVSTLMSLLEPVLIIFLGGLVGLIALSMFLPIMEIIKKLGH